MKLPHRPRSQPCFVGSIVRRLDQPASGDSNALEDHMRIGSSNPLEDIVEARELSGHQHGAVSVLQNKVAMINRWRNGRNLPHGHGASSETGSRATVRGTGLSLRVFFRAASSDSAPSRKREPRANGSDESVALIRAGRLAGTP